MIDIHTHILPGLDDGPQSMEEALAMAQTAVALGIHTVVATPHAFAPGMDVSPGARDEALFEFRTELKRRSISLQVLPGFECHIVEHLLERLAVEPRYFMPANIFDISGKNRYVLVELADSMPVQCLESLLFKCRAENIVPILAHPERHPDIRRDPTRLDAFRKRGGALQVTAKALAGQTGRRCRHICSTLIRNGPSTCIATDAHTLKDILPLALCKPRNSWTRRRNWQCARDGSTRRPQAERGPKNDEL